MPQFYTGDELGKIKFVKCTQQDKEWKFEEQAAYTPAIHAQFAPGAVAAKEIRIKAIQRLTASQTSEQTVVSGIYI